MKKIFALALVGLLGLAAAQTRGGSVTVAVAAEPPVMDLTASTSQEIARMLYDNVMQGLVKLNSKGEIVPALAEKWTASNSSLTWTFTLRKGVKFHNGSDFNAQDVVAKFNRAKDPKSDHVNKGYWTDVGSIEATNNTTVVFKLRQPNQDFLFNLARPDAVVGPSGLWDGQKTKPIGTGPFRFVAWDKGVGVRLERFEGYYDPKLPYLDKVTYRFLPDANAAIAGLRSGDLDMIGVSAENSLALARDPNFKVTQGSSTIEITVGMNNSKPPFNDIRVRKAMQYAINKQEIIQGVLLGYGTAIGAHRSPGEQCYVDTSGIYKFDADQARKLLAEAGFNAQNPLKFTFSLAAPYMTERRIGEAIAAQLQRVGVEAKLEVVEWSTWISRIFLGGDYQMTIIGHSEPNDIGIYANPNYYFKYNNPAFGKLYTEYVRNNNPTKACDAMKQMQRTLANDAVNVWVVNVPILMASRKNLMGIWTDQPTPSLNMTEAYLGK